MKLRFLNVLIVLVVLMNLGFQDVETSNLKSCATRLLLECEKVCKFRLQYEKVCVEKCNCEKNSTTTM